MCFHNSMIKKVGDLAMRYERKTDIIHVVRDLINEQYHINAFYFPKCAIITSDSEIQAFSWCLIPSWTSTVEDAQEIRKITLNIRAESIFQKPFSRESIMKRRCLIPSTGYFEWRYENGKKTPYFIHLKDEEIFSMAGIYDIWMDKETGSSLITFSLVTTRANPFAAYFQNVKKRMPLILSVEEEKKMVRP